MNLTIISHLIMLMHKFAPEDADLHADELMRVLAKLRAKVIPKVPKRVQWFYKVAIMDLMKICQDVADREGAFAVEYTMVDVAEKVRGLEQRLEAEAEK